MAGDSVGNRFGSATGAEDEVCSILNGINSKNTGKSTKFALKLLRDYCIVKEYDVDFENRNMSDLNLLLKEFYINLRQQNGELYTKSSFLVIRQSLNRYLRNPPVFNHSTSSMVRSSMKQTLHFNQCVNGCMNKEKAKYIINPRYKKVTCRNCVRILMFLILTFLEKFAFPLN